uniref:Ubiquitin-like domain-containing protein n=1 Tax=Macrostomum lignano TaxID=282301 RepID=A0A1I8GG84_9PLAT
MECKICNVKKLTSEYPSNPLSDLCEHHHLLVCLRCVIREVDKNYQCPVEGCSIMIDAAPGIFTVNLTTLLGESLSVDLDSNQPVDKLKDRVLQQWTDRSKNKIKLLFNGDELTPKLSISRPQQRLPGAGAVRAAGADAGPHRGSHVHVLGLAGGKDHTDYLDTACFTFSAGATGRIQFLHCIDFRSSHRQNAISAGISQTYNQVIRHDGPARKCGQTRTSESSFTVWPQNLDELRAPVGRFDQQNVPTVPVTHLFFVTFTYRNTNIDRFNHPQLQVFDQRDPQTPLCSTNLNPRAKGLVVCLLSKPGGRGAWQVTDVGQPLAEGSIRDYRPVERACVRIINSTRRG